LRRIQINIQSFITETHDNWLRGHIEPFWGSESIIELNYNRTELSPDQDIPKWKDLGYLPEIRHLCGELCDMRKPQPTWNNELIAWYKNAHGVTNVGTAYYRMQTDSMLPVHRDSYSRFRNIFNCKLEDCVRVVIFPFDWKPGHYFEIQETPIVNWKSGDYVKWAGDLPHMAANIGIEPRYTIQLTGICIK
jgi:hypothetical protein